MEKNNRIFQHQKKEKKIHENGGIVVFVCFVFVLRSATPFPIWLNRRQVGSHIGFCLQPVVISHIM